jgi:GH24 family phage-related lysozyme (muramidase)
MPDNVDYAFLSAREGGCKTTGYVPAASNSDSGVTIATGFDLGQRSEADLNGLRLSASLVAKLKPYLGKRKKDAVDALKNSPLSVTLPEAQQIDKASFDSHLSQLKLAYNAAVRADKTKKAFEDLPGQAQTAIASVAFQYGTRLSFRTPKFWKAVVSQDWKDATKVLRNFGDVYPTRRGLEADLLDKIP